MNKIILLAFLSVVMLNSTIVNSSDDLVLPEFQMSFNVLRTHINMIILDKDNKTLGDDMPELTKYDVKLNIKENGNVIVSIDAKFKFQQVLKEFIETGKYTLEIYSFKNYSYRIQDSMIVVFDIIDNDCEIISVNKINYSEKDIGEINTSYYLNNKSSAIVIKIDSKDEDYKIQSPELSLQVEYEVKNGIMKYIDPYEGNWKNRLPIQFYSRFYAWSLNITVAFPKYMDIILENSHDVSKVEPYVIQRTYHFVTPDKEIKSKLSYNTGLTLLERIQINWDFQLFWAVIGVIIGVIIGFFLGSVKKRNNKKKSSGIQTTTKGDKNYLNRDWLKSEIEKGKKVQQIAFECDVSVSTIYRYMKK